LTSGGSRGDLEVEREAAGIGERAAALVLDVGREDQLRGDRGRQRRLELDLGDGRLAPSSTGASSLPPPTSSRTASACARGTGALNSTLIASIGLQPDSTLTRGS
jgi:hypothetical protein